MTPKGNFFVKELENRTCFITGAANGIGRTFATKLAEEDMNLFLGDIDIMNLEKTINEVKEIGISVYGSKCDVSKIEDYQNAKKRFYSKYD
ncbi:MAG: SDR family NAD(P)-dependent oxidoreductase [Candidatus Lokiarchaeota archaeon]|nr:SDR family NAD(P)-dependent oxidoreductase [Candidatus Lokiarchaeota archaeon]